VYSTHSCVRVTFACGDKQVLDLGMDFDAHLIPCLSVLTKVDSKKRRENFVNSTLDTIFH